LRWASDTEWKFINETAQRLESGDAIDEEDGDYFAESAKIYFKLRLGSSKIVNIPDPEVKNFLSNSTIVFLIGLISNLTGEPIPIERDDERDTAEKFAEHCRSFLTDKASYRSLLKIGYIHERLLDLIKTTRERIPGDKLSTMCSIDNLNLSF
jgi:hypothetical protein